MAQARIAGAKVIESEIYAQSFEGVKYRRSGCRILHQEGFSELKFQKASLKTGLREDRADTCDESVCAQFYRGNINPDANRREPDILPGLCLMTGFPEQPPTDRHDKSALFRNRNEFRRRNESAVGMKPSDERLNPDDIAGLQINLRLIVQH